MDVNKNVYSFYIILLDLAVFHSKDHKLNVVASPVNRPTAQAYSLLFEKTTLSQSLVGTYFLKENLEMGRPR